MPAPEKYKPLSSISVDSGGLPGSTWSPSSEPDIKSSSFSAAAESAEKYVNKWKASYYALVRVVTGFTKDMEMSWETEFITGSQTPDKWILEIYILSMSFGDLPTRAFPHGPSHKGPSLIPPYILSWLLRLCFAWFPPSLWEATFLFPFHEIYLNFLSCALAYG